MFWIFFMMLVIGSCCWPTLDMGYIKYILFGQCPKFERATVSCLTQKTNTKERLTESETCYTWEEGKEEKYHYLKVKFNIEGLVCFSVLILSNKGREGSQEMFTLLFMGDFNSIIIVFFILAAGWFNCKPTNCASFYIIYGAHLKTAATPKFSKGKLEWNLAQYKSLIKEKKCTKSTNE